MKRLIMILFGMLLFGNIYAQRNALFFTHNSLYAQRNALYLSFQPVDLGVGLRYDHRSNENGIYASASYGNYRFEDDRYFIHDHVRLALGGLTYKEKSFLSMGVAWNHHGEQRLPSDFNRRALQRFTLELGAGTNLERINVAFRVDVVTWTSSIDLGFNF